MSWNPPRTRAAGARRIVLAVLWSNLIWSIAIPWHLTHPSQVASVIFLGGLLLVGTAQALVLRAAVSSWINVRYRLVVSGPALALTVGLWWPALTWAERGQAPWSWLAGLTLGAICLAVSWRWSVPVAVGLSAVCVTGALLHDGAVARHLLTLLGSAAVVVVMMYGLVWLLSLLIAAEHAKAMEANLAVAQERERAGRELHDSLGHRLAVIALKAELVGDFAALEPERARAESDEIRRLATATMAEVRQALHGETVTDLDKQLHNAGLVLESAGVRLELDRREITLTGQESQLLATVLREAITNILRHARARKVCITLRSEGTERELVIANDHAGPASGTERAEHGGTGLDGLRTRCAQHGATVDAGPTPQGGYAVRIRLARVPSPGLTPYRIG